GTRPAASEHRSEPSRLFQAGDRTARWLGIRGSHRRLESAHAGGFRGKPKPTEYGRDLPEDVEAPWRVGTRKGRRDRDFVGDTSGRRRSRAVFVLHQLRKNDGDHVA